MAHAREFIESALIPWWGWLIIGIWIGAMVILGISLAVISGKAEQLRGYK